MGPTKAPSCIIAEMAYCAHGDYVPHMVQLLIYVTGMDLSSIFKKGNWNSFPVGIAILKISPPEYRCIFLETVTSPKLNSISYIFWKRYGNLQSHYSIKTTTKNQFCLSLSITPFKENLLCLATFITMASWVRPEKTPLLTFQEKSQSYDTTTSEQSCTFAVFSLLKHGLLSIYFTSD